MIKTIFVPMSGSTSDDSVFVTAFEVARPLDAHLDFYHVRLSGSEAAARSVPLQFCPATVLGAALTQLESREEAYSDAAMGRFEAFCGVHAIPLLERPSTGTGLSAWRIEEIDRSHARFIFHARNHDLVVLGRPHSHDPIRDSLIETVLTRCGQPVVIAPGVAPRGPIETVVVGWNESSAAVRALAAAMPLLKAAASVLLVAIEDHCNGPDSLNEVVRHLEWHGVRAASRFVHNSKQPAAAQLLDAVEEIRADLLVAGGYGHMPLREVVFGGVTQSLIERAEIPVLLMH
jgi:nucleotide-binding universal stress UspA family protein